MTSDRSVLFILNDLSVPQKQKTLSFLLGNLLPGSSAFCLHILLFTGQLSVRQLRPEQS